MKGITPALLQGFAYQPTEGQKNLFSKFEVFLLDKSNDRKALVVKGYAGTGKTTAIKAITDILPSFNFRTVLMAPTGRAAKVMTSYTGKKAGTIHRTIYRLAVSQKSGGFYFKRVANADRNTLYIVDEASMISDDRDFASKSLLEDLIEFVFSSPTNRLLLIGDVAQLPPVGQKSSPALDYQHLNFRYDIQADMVELTEVVRQVAGSGILVNATNLRSQLDCHVPEISFRTAGFKDVFKMTAEKLEDGLRYAYDKYGLENTAIICRSNWQAVRYNELIRRNILFYEEELEAGDVLMVVKNNYLWLPESSKAGFIANGDFAEVRKIISNEERYGFRFAYLRLQLLDYPDEESFDAWVILDTLHSKTPALAEDEQQKLYNAVLLEHAHESSKKKKQEAMQKDVYLNALQIKFAYALTCHKSQGGQWKLVFIDQGLIRDQEVDNEYVRWLYTGITRASEELYLMNFKPEFFR
ncbi:MAG: ATP-dependent RecD-like DNA helicase [Cyclobacteriaceae bacterium]